MSQIDLLEESKKENAKLTEQNAKLTMDITERDSRISDLQDRIYHRRINKISNFFKTCALYALLIGYIVIGGATCQHVQNSSDSTKYSHTQIMIHGGTAGIAWPIYLVSKVGGVFVSKTDNKQVEAKE